jgi:4-amino-4-deoxy-L-arabinose transferase-like glycosyltransferase
LVWSFRAHLWELLRPRVILPFLLIAVPWHVICYLRNGRIFPYTLFVQQQMQRLTSGALLHTQPWWYYLPAFLGLLLPWTPLLLLSVRRDMLRDPRRQFLLLLVLFGLVFFSIAPNKLAGYVLPLLPAAALLMAMGLEESGGAAYSLAACALLVVTILVAAPLLPPAVAVGLTHAPRPSFRWFWMLPAVVAAAVWLLDRNSRRVAAVVLVGAATAVGLVYVKQTATAELDRVASARPLWQQIAGHADQVCTGNLKRDFQYGLSYYSEVPLPACAELPRPWRLEQRPGMPPQAVPLFERTVDLH